MQCLKHMHNGPGDCPRCTLEAEVNDGLLHPKLPNSPSLPVTLNYQPGYKELADVLQAALDQAQHGKGKDRHACNRPFLNQPMMVISRMTGTGGPIYQAMKKAQESMRLTPDRAIAELYGAINYLAGAILIIEERRKGGDSAA